MDVDPPLHSMPLKPDQWWACEYPERQHEYYKTIYDERCKACFISLDAALKINIPLENLYSLDPATGEVTGRRPNDYLSQMRKIHYDDT